MTKREYHRKLVREAATQRKSRRFSYLLSGKKLNWVEDIAGNNKDAQEDFLQEFLNKVLYNLYMDKQMTRAILRRYVKDSIPT